MEISDPKDSITLNLKEVEHDILKLGHSAGLFGFKELQKQLYEISYELEKIRKDITVNLTTRKSK